MTKKIAVIGPHSSGKSSLILKYIKKSYTDSYLSTMWADCFVDSQSNHVWDTPGAARFFEDTEKICGKVNGYVLCFCPSDEESFHHAMTIASDLKIEGKPVVMAACKTDILPLEIKPQWSSEAAIRGWKIIGTSASSGVGITRLFQEIFNIVEETDEVNLSYKEYASEKISSCIYSGINNYIYELDTDDC